MDNNNFEKEQQNSVKESENQVSEEQRPEENSTSSEYYNNGPKLPRSEVPKNSVKAKSAGNVQTAAFSKDKIAIIIAMGALALVLISVVMLITFCGGASGHKHEYRFTLDKDGDKFVLIGECTVDGCTNPHYTDRNLTNVEPTEEVDATCLSGGKVVYSYERDGVIYVYEEITGEALSHTIDGKSIDSFRREDGSLLYMPPYVTLFAGDEVTCGLLTNGSYRCSVCGDVGSSMVYVDHASNDTWKPVAGQAATCTAKGYEELNCKYCNVQMEKREAAALGHELSYMLSTSNDKFYLHTTCLNGQCTYSDKKEVPIQSMRSEVLDATCSRPTTVIHYYTTDTGEEVNVKVESGTVSGVHIIDGKSIESFDSDKDGIFDYGVSKNIKLFGGTRPSNGKECGKVCKGYFECESCQGVVNIDVRLPGHSCATQPVVIKHPTETAHGQATTTCSNPWCSEADVVVLLDLISVGDNTVKNADGNYTYTTKVDGFTVVIDKIKVAAK